MTIGLSNVKITVTLARAFFPEEATNEFPQSLVKEKIQDEEVESKNYISV